MTQQLCLGPGVPCISSQCRFATNGTCRRQQCHARLDYRARSMCMCLDCSSLSHDTQPAEAGSLELDPVSAMCFKSYMHIHTCVLTVCPETDRHIHAFILSGGNNSTGVLAMAQASSYLWCVFCRCEPLADKSQLLQHAHCLCRARSMLASESSEAASPETRFSLHTTLGCFCCSDKLWLPRSRHHMRVQQDY